MSIFGNMMSVANSFQGGTEDQLSEIEQALLSSGQPLQSPAPQQNPFGLGQMGGPTPFNPITEQQEKDETQAANKAPQMMDITDNGNDSIAGNFLKMFMGMGGF